MKYAALGFVLAATVALGAPGDLIILRPDPNNDMKDKRILDRQIEEATRYVETMGARHVEYAAPRSDVCGNCHVRNTTSHAQPWPIAKQAR